MKFRFPIVIIDEDYRSENTSGLGIRALAQAIDSLTKVINCIWDSLVLVMRDEPLPNKKEEKTDIPYSTPLAGELKTQTERIKEQTASLQSCLDRLEI